MAISFGKLSGFSADDVHITSDVDEKCSANSADYRYGRGSEGGYACFIKIKSGHYKN